jgi:hypothetical protein
MEDDGDNEGRGTRDEGRGDGCRNIERQGVVLLFFLVVSLDAEKGEIGGREMAIKRREH